MDKLYENYKASSAVKVTSRVPIETFVWSDKLFASDELEINIQVKGGDYSWTYSFKIYEPQTDQGKWLANALTKAAARVGYNDVHDKLVKNLK